VSDQAVVVSFTLQFDSTLPPLVSFRLAKEPVEDGRGLLGGKAADGEIFGRRSRLGEIFDWLLKERKGCR
jgi:hypothetical protein